MPIRDLLHNQRGNLPRDPNLRRVAIIVGVVLVIGIAVILFFPRSVDEIEVDLPDPEVALAGANANVAGAVKTSFLAADAHHQAQATKAEAIYEASYDASWIDGEPALLRGEIKRNQTVSVSLQERGLPSASVHFAIAGTAKKFDFRSSRPGDKWEAEVDAKGRIVRFQYQTSPENIWVTTRIEQGNYEVTKLDIPIETRLEAVAGEISQSFWVALEATGESGALAYRFMDIFAYTIDFNTETRDGDRFAMVFEKIYLNGEYLRYGRVLAAHYDGARGSHFGFFHETKDESAYYDLTGDSLQRQFLRSPLPVTRITSRYGRRVHPIHGDTRMHRGVDYGAPTGTPIQSVADGTVTYAGWRGSYGKLVIVRHRGNFETRYAHMSTIGRGITSGKRVARGDLLGKVGATGGATGPHLHFEMLRGGKHVDPLTVDTERGEPLRGKERDHFKEHVVKPRLKLLKDAAQARPSKPPVEVATPGSELAPLD